MAFVGPQKKKRRESLGAEKHHTPQQLYHSKDLGRYLKFLNREESINQLLVHAQKQFGFYKFGYREKDFQFTTCSGGPGLGKVTSQSAFFSLKRPPQPPQTLRTTPFTLVYLTRRFELVKSNATVLDNLDFHVLSYIRNPEDKQIIE